MATDGEIFGHKQMTVLEQIQSILEKYPFGDQILKEVIQNADDAQAERVDFMLDLDSHSQDRSGLVDPSLAKYQGPALYSWNSASFCERDWKGIEETGRSCKKEDYLKVGRFGLGFISMYHITDCPWIISNQNICYLDPQNPDASGRRYSLSSFFANPKYSSHHSCFSRHYFGFNCESEFGGTIFRFPLRTGSYSSCISNEIHGVDEIRSVLFNPLIQEGEHIIPFLKYVNSIRILEKVNNRVSVIHSVAVPDRFKQSLYVHRKEITLFAENRCYHEKTGLFITVYPIDTNGNETIWLVMNLLGFGKRSVGKSDNEFYRFYCKNTLKYIPWFGIAMPTRAKSCPSIENNHTWKYDWNGTSVESILEFIQSNVRFSLEIPSDSILDTNDGKYYCFLPIPKESLFPFHIHAYFALDDNRKSPKWPSSYDRSPDSKWNMFQSEMLGAVLYASFLHLSVLNFSHSKPENYHYKLFGDFNIHEMDDSLFSIIQREGLRLLLDKKLVFSQSIKWIPIGKALYTPSTIPELVEGVWTSETERCCINLLLMLSEPIVELPSNIIALIATYQFLKESIEPQILSPKRIRDILRLNSLNTSCIDFLATKRNAIQLLDVVLWDLDPTSNDVHLEEALEGIPLLLTADSSIKPNTFSGDANEIFYISEKTLNYLSIFPGLESRFVDPALPQNIHGKLVKISRVIDINIKDITQIQPDTFKYLLTQFFNTTFHSVTPPLTWTPGCNNQPRANWIKSLWEFIGTSSTLLSAVEQFPILPKGLLSSQSIQLLSVQYNEVPYVEFDATRGATEIENILSEAGCELCHRHFFIQCFDDFVLRQVPQCLISVLRMEHILTQFISLISKTSDGTHRQLIELFNSIPLDSREARDIVKRVPIFLNFKGHWLALSTQIGQRVPVLAPKTIPDDIDYPPHILTPFDNPLVMLYQKLNISHNNENEFIRLDLVPYMISNELFQFPQTRNLLAVWVLERLPALQLATGDELLEFLRDTKWLVDSSTPGDKTGQVKLFKPSGMLNPIDPLLKQLIDRSNEGFFPNGIYDDHVEKMKKYFEFKSNDSLNSRLRKEVSKAAINNLRGRKCYGDWLTMFRALLQLISYYFEKCELRDQESLWKEFNKKFVLSQIDIQSLIPLKLPFDGSSSLCFPPQVIPCTLEQVPLISFVSRFIILQEISSPENGDYKDILSCMGFQTHIPCSLVVEQLNYIIDSFHNKKCDSSNLYVVMYTIYQNLNLHTTSASLKELRSCFIFSQERIGFIEIANITECTDFDMRPYLYSYANLGYSCLELFRSLGMSRSPTADQYSSVLNSIYTQSNGNSINNQQLEIVLKILEVSNLDPDIDIIYVPGYDNVMYPTSEGRLVFSNEKWLNPIQICSEFPFVFAHERISRVTAINLRIRSFYEHVANSAIYSTLDQNQTVIHEIKSVLELYTDEIGLVREMVQNSDDAGASQLKILFDYRCHPSMNNPDSSSLLSSGMHHWQGPAIWFYNDRAMQESDYHNILCVGGEGKANDVSKIGRDGVGFCSAFYLTDLPSFVSGDTLHILDPHKEYTEQNYSQSNVCKVEFCSKKFIKFYRDQFAPYQDLFGCNILNNESYNSTLFRIPLRSDGIKSQLSVKSYDKNRMESLQRSVIKYVENILLFTENLTLIEISELRENTFTNAGVHIKPIYWVKREPENSQSFLKIQKYNLEKCLQGESIDSIEHSFECSISSSTMQSPKHWLLCYTSGSGDELAGIVSSMENENCRIHAPFTAVAFDLDRLTEQNLLFETNLFCLHPLSVSLQLPYHCNGMFELDSGKMALCDEDMEWNTFLISNSLTNAVLNLYTCIAEKTEPNLYCHFLYNIFSKEMISQPIWKSFCAQITHKLMESKARLFPVTSSQGNSWNCFSEVVVLNELELKDKIVEAYFNQNFSDSIKQFLINLKGLQIATVPAELYRSSGLLSFLLKHTNSDSIIGIQRIVELFFDSLSEISEGLMMGILPALIVSHSSIPSLSDLISNVPCIPCGDSYQLMVPSCVIDPNNRILSDLYYPEENRLPSSRAPLFTTDSLCYRILKKDFSLLSNQLTLSILQERVDKVVADGDTHLAEKIVVYLNQDIFSNSDADQMYARISNQRFLPTLQDYPISNQSEDSLAAPNQVVVYSLRHFLGLQRTVLTYDVSCLGHAIKLLKIQPNSVSEIRTEMLLDEIVVCRENYEKLSLHSQLLLEKMACLYGELAERMDKDKALIVDNIVEKCIYIPDVGFVPPERVIFEHERSFSPYIHGIKFFYRLEAKLKNFYLSIGVGRTLTLQQCLEVLRELSEADNELDSTDEALALTLIDEMANRLYKEIGESSSTITVFLLGEDKYIHESSESIFFDLKWKDKGGYKGDIKINNKSYYFVHPQISNNTADKLGAISLSSSIITIASKKLKFGYQVKSQEERLTNRLKDIVDRYEAPVEVFKELIQNADDAKAKTVKFLFDLTSYDNTSLIRPKMEVCQGPSLYVYNDKTFSPNDFKNIMDIGGETKKTDTTKIGRFGLGFNTVYHLTDIPSFVSGRFIHILDPHLFCGERGLEINFTENEAILKECYFDQFTVYNDIFDCNVFSETPYDGTLFRFPFRNSRTCSEIKPTGLFSTKAEIKKLLKSFLDIIEQVIFFLQYVQTIEVYERREKEGKIQLICKVEKSFKNRPYQTSFLNNYENHFNSIVKCKREEHVSAIEVIEISRDKSSCEEYILSYASGTGECVDVINQFEELKQASVLPVSAVGIPRQLLTLKENKANRKNEEDFRLFCFLPIPKKSPYRMHINGYFHLSSYRTELHITEENAHLTQWNCSLVNDALPNALLSLLMHIREELLPQGTSRSSTDLNTQLEKYYSYFPLSDIKEKPWDAFPSKTTKKIIESDLPIFPCALHPEIWLSFSEVSFLTCTTLNAEFIMFLKKFAVEMEIFFVDIPNSLNHTQFFKNLFKKSTNSYDFNRVCDELLFPNLEDIKETSLKDLKLVIYNLLDQYSHGSTRESPLHNLAFIPCGDLDPVLRIPSEVVHPDSEFSSIYYPEEKRLPHPEFHDLFKKKVFVLRQLDVIEDYLRENELIERCELAQSIYSEDKEKGHEHSMVILKFINKCDKIPDSLLKIDFLPVWDDPLFIHLDCREIGYMIPAVECYSYFCRYLITHKYFALSEDVSKLNHALELLRIPTSVKDPNMIVELLEIFCSKEESLGEYEDDSLDERMRKIYYWLAEFCFPARADSEGKKKKEFRIEFDKVGDEKKQLKESLKNKSWIWHPIYKEFYEISQVKIASDFLAFKSKFLITFPYPDLLTTPQKNNNVQLFFEFMGLKPNVEHTEAIEILSKMRVEYNGKRLSECDFELAKRLILEEVGKYYDKNKDETPPGEICLLSEDQCLHLAEDLFRNDIGWMEDTFSDTDKEFIVNKYIPPFMAHKLGAKSKRSTYFEEESIEGIRMEEFGPNEAISDRIENIKKQINCDVTILNELLQNAEDAGATEIAFILDNQEYKTDHLCFASDTHKRWQKLQSTPSLLVYNNQGFTENDLIGIQKVGIGGKRSLQTIGRFGIGFNAVYHLTRSPCLLTSPTGGNTTTFCIFDPYREYLNISEKSELPGKKILIRNDCKHIFKDQLKPYEVLPITENDKFPDMLSNLKLGESYSLFRFPLTATKTDIQKKIDNMLDQLLDHSKRLLLFLKNIKRIDIMCIDKNGEVQPKGILISNTNLHPDISPDLPEFYSGQYLKSVVVTLKQVKTEKWTAPSVKTQATNEVRIPESSSPACAEFKLKKETSEWLCYNHEQSVEYFPDHGKFSDKIETEKLRQIFGSIALNITNISTNQKMMSYIFCFLPIGTSFNFPVHINAPLIVDQHRRFLKFSEKGQEGGEEQWEYTWHKSIIHHVLVPLYAKLLLDLKDSRMISTDMDPAVYYSWYHSIFPNVRISKANNAPFLELISRELYTLLHETDQPVLISNDLKDFYSINGNPQGVFKVKTCYKLHELYSALNNIQYPLTGAPDRILEQIKSLKLECQTLQPEHLINFLINNKQLLSREDEFPCELKDSVLTFEEVLTLLEFVLEGSNDQLNALSEIPLKIDSQEVICSFNVSTEDTFLTFLSDYAPLLPHCSSNFIHPEFTKQINDLLTHLGFIRNLTPQFLANNLIIDEDFTKPCYFLFWRFAIEVCKSIDIVIQLFGTHVLVPVYHKGEDPDSKSFYNYPISQLDCVVSEELLGSTTTLCTALRKLDCPFLDLKDFNDEGFGEKLLTFVKNQVISETNQVSLPQLVGCLSEGLFLTAELGIEEALLLRKFMSGMQDPLIKLSAQVLVKLRIFLTNNRTLKAVDEFKVCFLNEGNFKIEQFFTQELEAEGIGIFSVQAEDENPTNLIKCVACEMKIQIINTEQFVSEYILPCFPDLPLEEQKSYLVAISKLAGTVENNLYTQLCSIPFIKKQNSEDKVTTDQLYLRTVRLFKLCLKDELLPKDWDDETLINILTKLGLNTVITLPILKDCACIIADNTSDYPGDKINQFISILVIFLKEMRLSTQTNIALLGAISDIKFVPIKKIKEIDGQELTYDREIGSLQSALPHSNLGICGTMCYILPELISDIPQEFWQYLNIQTNPPCSVVIEHLRAISEQCQEQTPEDNVVHERLFHETYAYLQNLPDFTSQQLEFNCIISNGIIFSKMNLVFEIEKEIFSYLFKVPSSLSNFQNFLTVIGVKRTATFTHYISVLKCIYLKSTPTDHHLEDEKMSTCAKIAFSILVTMLRSLPSDVDIDLDPADTHVLTDDNRIMPCNIVYYADNTSLLAKVKRDTRIEINILKTLPPDENGSGVPPPHLKIQNLKQVLIPSLSGTISGYQIHNQLQTIYLQIFKSQHFHRSLMRLYYHETNKNIQHLKLRDGQIYYSEDQNEFPTDEGYKPVLELVGELSVISVSQIDLDLTDKRTDEVFCIPNALSCYIDLNTNVFYVNSSADKRNTLPTFVAKELNSFLAKIFSKTLNALEFCFKIALDNVMSVFDELEIQNCPFLDEIPFPQTTTVAVPPVVPAATPATTLASFISYRPSGPVTLSSLTSHRTYARAANPRPGVGAERPDPLAAKLWIRTAQCDWRAASKLSKKSSEECTLFPPQSCFLCFEATHKALIAVLFLCGGSSCDIFQERNLCLLLGEVSKYTTEAIATRLEELVIPLMNYDEPTRYPCMTSGIGFYTPREYYTLDVARGAIKSVRQILHKLKEATRQRQPSLESLMIEEGESGYIELSCLSINEMFNFPMDCDLAKINLETDSDEFFTVARSFFATLPQMKIISIEKIINRKCWNNFKRNVELQVSRFGENCLMIKPLFHGTSSTHPSYICQHDVGFSMDYSNVGMWGKGLYFAVNSSYSNRFAYDSGNGEFCMFLAQVFVGYSEVKKSDMSIVRPNGKFHSVQGCTGGSQVHILYQNGLAYPSYLITYSR